MNEPAWPPVFRRRLQRLLGAAYPAFEAAQETPALRGLRVNTLKTTAAQLLALNALPLLRPLPYAREAFGVATTHRAGADPLHHAGAYYMQEPSAMSAVTMLAPAPGERVLDLCAAPGGKSTQIAAALNGRGLLWANEYVRPRAKTLLQNLERCGVRNAVVSSSGAETLCEGLAGWFDAVLVDAPCSGEGMFRKEPAALEQWSPANIRLCAQRQAAILDAAAQAVRPGGRLVYATCTFAPEENECQVARFLAAHAEFEPLPLEEDFQWPLPAENTASNAWRFGRPGFDWDAVAPFACGEADDPAADALTYARGAARYRPDACCRLVPGCEQTAHNGGMSGEGHFVARFRRREDVSADRPIPRMTNVPTSTICTDFMRLYTECFSDAAYGTPAVYGEQVRLLPEEMPDCRGLGVLAAGVTAAEICRGTGGGASARLEPAHALFQAAHAAACRQAVSFAPDDPRLLAFLRGETVEAPGRKGWTAVCVADIPTGFGKASGGVLKNRYPKGLRLLSR